MEVAESELGAGLGERLRRAREQRGLTVDECAERLYLPASVITALEGEQFATLGAGVYARGHLRRYAGLLELDAAGLEQLMLQRLSAAPDLANIQTHRITGTGSSRRLGVVPVAIVAVVLALVVLVWWSLRHGSERTPATPVVVPATPAPATVAPTAPAAPAPASPTAGARAPSAGAAAAGAEAPATPAAGPVAPPAESARTTPLVVASASPKAAAPPTSSAPASASAPRRRVAPPEPASAVPHETQRDYTNFDF